MIGYSQTLFILSAEVRYDSKESFRCRSNAFGEHPKYTFIIRLDLKIMAKPKVNIEHFDSASPSSASLQAWERHFVTGIA